MKFTEADVLRAIQKVQEGQGPEGFTVQELVLSGKITPHMARAKIKRLLASGKMRAVKLKRRRMDDLLTTVSGYQLVKK